MVITRCLGFNRDSVLPPFMVRVRVKSTDCHGNSFVIFLVGENMKYDLSVFGNVNKVNGVYYGVWASDSRNALQVSLGTRIFASPQNEDWYTFEIEVDKMQKGTITLTSEEQVHLSSWGLGHREWPLPSHSWSGRVKGNQK